MFDLDAQALAAKADGQSLENFIKSSRRFILVCASRATRRFVTENDDEWSVALLAFSQAVKEYDGTKGGFRSFAYVVISRRLTDHLRSEARHAGEIPMEPCSLEGETPDGEEPTPLLQEVRRRTAELSEEAGAGVSAGDARDEINEVQALLSGYGFSFFELADCSPKAEKTKKSCAGAVNVLLGSEELMRRMRLTRSLPMKELCEASGVPRKILERHRKYIIAAAEILDGEYPIVGGYLSYIRKAMGA